MAVAAYASLLSLTDVLDSFPHLARRHRLHLDTEQIQILQEKVQFLQDFLELHSRRISPEMEDLARQLVVVADEADDIIDFHVVNQLRERSQDKSLHSSFYQDISNIIEKIDSITKELMMVKEELIDVQEQQPGVSLPVGSTALPSSDENSMVGFDERLLVVDELTRDQSNIQILPIVGMGGIGKTTLARYVLDHPNIVYRFDIRVWFTISQQYSVREVLLKYFLDDKRNKQGKKLAESGEEELGEHLYKLLSGKRYLIIMDDVWSIRVWKDFRKFFPNNGNGSRILVTTRLFDVARSLGSHNHCLKINFLGDDQSWNLLCEKVFAQKSCPYPELEEIGRNIARCCRGLPLAIVVIGGLLAKSNNTREYWEFVAKNVTSFVNYGDDEYCLKILSLSYNNLPIHLKPCFLYIRVFPEDDEIEASKLIKLWISEGFLKPIGGKSLEEAAQEYLKDLTHRNLILIRKWTCSGKIKTCGVHDILRELCFREAEREHLIRVPKAQAIPSSVSIEADVCFVCSSKVDRRNRIHLQEVLVGLRSTSITSPSTCEACNNMYQDLNKLRWVKVFKSVHDESDVTSPLHTKLRYLHVKGYDSENRKLIVPDTIYLLWNLQILHLGCLDTASLSEIWEIPKLRHLSVDSLLDPVEGQDSTILENLSTVRIGNFRCSEEIVKRIPNLKKLHVSWTFSADKLAQLNKLESLSLRYNYSRLEDIAFPTSLKKLTLSICQFPWEKMTIIGSSLPNLEVLKLNDAFEGPEWRPIEGEFLGLKVLTIVSYDLVQWEAEDIHFPNLHRLDLEFMSKLKEIPLSIGDINTLHSIHLAYCTKSVINSAVEILKDQKEKGNDSLQVYVGGEQIHVSL